jgi:pimeloyl-ACP methyl ester carboxylesterase
MKKLISFLVIATLTIVTHAQLSDTIFIQAENVKIHTVLCQPDAHATPNLAIFIAGSGPTDLNGNQPRLTNNSLQDLSDALVANNIATLRFDKRGVAKSSFDHFSEAELNIKQYADDVKELIKFSFQRGFKNIYIIGHSEGSLIGLIAAQQYPIKGFVSLCGAGNSADVLLKKQLQTKLPAELYLQTESIIDSLKDGHTVQSVPPQLLILFRPSVQSYLISWFNYQPSELITHLECPTLIVQAGKDIQIDPEEGTILHKSAPNARLVHINQMNHVLKTITGDLEENLAAYSNPELPVNEELVQTIVGFIN